MRNGMDRFAIADGLNARVVAVHGGDATGPFWGRPDWTLLAATLAQLPPAVTQAAPFAPGLRAGGGAARRAICAAHGITPARLPHLDMTSPGFPLQVGGTQLSRLRATERQGHGAQEAWKLGGDGFAKHWIPEHDNLLFASKMADPHSTATLYFSAPKKQGKYPFVCTLPGHAQIMNGTMMTELPMKDAAFATLTRRSTSASTAQERI